MILILYHLLKVTKVANLSEFLSSKVAVQSALDTMHLLFGFLRSSRDKIIGSTLCSFEKKY